MKRKNLLSGVVGALIVGASAYLVYRFIYQDAKREPVIDSSNYIGTPGEEVVERISLEEAVSEISRAQQSKKQEVDPFEYYRKLNELYQSAAAPCNQGDEPLSEFMKKFASNSSFRRNRIRLIDESVTLPNISEHDFYVISPDETGFFASWSTLEADSAAFCNGWLDSEKAEEYFFKRINAKWYLVDYFDGMDYGE